MGVAVAVVTVTQQQMVALVVQAFAFSSIGAHYNGTFREN